MRSSSNECRLNLISNEMKTIKAKPYAQQWHLYPDDKLLCLIMTSTQTRTCTSAYMCDVDAWWKVVSMAWLWHEIKEAPATSQTMEKYVQSYRKLCHSNWCSFELLWDNDYASIWIYILQKHTDSDWKCHHISLPLCRSCSRLSHIITVCCHIDKICRVRMNGYVHIGECECGCVCVCDFFPRIPVRTYTKEQNSFSYRNILIANTLNSKLAKKMYCYLAFFALSLVLIE